ncbi:MAG: hypothetical protein ACRAUW_15245 [Aeromonas sp.]|uniref:hypothetical protein n=1 Tax=Aeromonas sp. TaxID=647 RepID=UPI003D6BBFBA
MIGLACRILGYNCPSDLQVATKACTLLAANAAQRKNNPVNPLWIFVPADLPDADDGRGTAAEDDKI